MKHYFEISFIVLALSTVTSCVQEQKQEAQEEPVEVAGMGCWVNFYNAKNFFGHKLTIRNEIEVPSLHFSEDNNWKGEVESIETGPDAELTVYHRENFDDYVFKVGPNKKLTGYNELAFSNVGSFKLRCLE